MTQDVLFFLVRKSIRDKVKAGEKKYPENVARSKKRRVARKAISNLGPEAS